MCRLSMLLVCDVPRRTESGFGSASASLDCIGVELMRFNGKEIDFLEIFVNEFSSFLIVHILLYTT